MRSEYTSTSFTGNTQECLTIDQKQCIFPIKYQDREYHWCTMADHNESWCGTKVENTDSIIEWGACSENCPGYQKEEPTCRTTDNRVHFYSYVCYFSL